MSHSIRRERPWRHQRVFQTKTLVIARAQLVCIFSRFKKEHRDWCIIKGASYSVYCILIGTLSGVTVVLGMRQGIMLQLCPHEIEGKSEAYSCQNAAHAGQNTLWLHCKAILIFVCVCFEMTSKGECDF